jgi:putative protease
MRSPYYLATVISSYRKIIDNYYNNTLTDEVIEKEEKILSRVANRETSTHYYLKEADHLDQYYTGRQELSNQDFLGQVLDYDKDEKILTLTQRNYFKENDSVEIFTPDGNTYSFVIDEVYNEKMERIEVARHPEEIIKLKLDFDVEENSMMRIKVK